MQALAFLTLLAFGQNKIQHKAYHFLRAETPHFVLYYYQGGEGLATFASVVLEKAFVEYQDLFRLSFDGKIPVILYNAPKDFQETNVVSGILPEGVGGFTELFKLRMVIPFAGSYTEFRHVLRHELVHVFQYQAMRKTLRTLTNVMGFSPPLWVMEGMAEYLARPWDSDAESFVRDQVFHDRLLSLQILNQAGGYVVYKEGQALYRFLDQSFGRQRMVSFFYNLIRQRQVDRALKTTFKLSTARINDLFILDLKTRLYPRTESYVFPKPPSFRRLTDHRGQEGFLNMGPALSPAGDYLAVISDQDLTTSIYLISGVDGRIIRKLVSGERTPDLENLHLLRPSLAFSPDGERLAFVSQAQNGDLLHILDIRTGKRESFPAPRGVDALATPTWHPDGQRLVVVGIHQGQSDLFLFDLALKQWQPLTQDLTDDRDPAIDDEGTWLYYVTDAAQRDDTLWVFGGYRLVRRNLQTGEVDTLTPPLHHIAHPIPYEEKVFFVYTPGPEEVPLLVLYDPVRMRYAPLIPFWSGVREVSATRDRRRWAFSSLYQGGYDVFLFLPDSFPTPSEELVAVNPETLKIHPLSVGVAYRPLENFSLDWAVTQVYYTDPYTSAGGVVYLGASDVLGNHQLLLGLQAYYSFDQALRDIYFHLQYEYLARPEDYTLIYTQYLELLFQGYALANGQWVPYIALAQQRVLLGEVRYPLSQFQRFELGGGLEWPTYYGLIQIPQGIYLVDQKDFWNLFGIVGWVWDNVVYSYETLGPLDGSRARILAMSTAIPSLERSGGYRSYWSALGDFRLYWKLTPRMLFALRGVAATAGGRDAWPYALGGPSTVRGYDYASIVGLSVAYANVEFRFPFIRRIQMDLLPLFLGNVRGVFFADGGAAGNSFQTITLDHLYFSAGVGMRMSLGSLFLLKLDVARPFKIDGTTLPWRWVFSIGPDF